MMENEISIIASWGSAQEMAAEHSSNTDGTLHEGIISPSDLGDGEDIPMISVTVSTRYVPAITAEQSLNNDSTLQEGFLSPSDLDDGEDVLMTDHPGYSDKVEHRRPSDRIDSLHTPETGRTSRLGFYNISMDVDSERLQSPGSNLFTEVNGTSHTGHRARPRRMATSDLPVMTSAGDAGDATTVSYTLQASTPHAMDIEMFDEDIDGLSPTLLYRNTALPAGGLEDENTDGASHMVITGISDTHYDISIPDEETWNDEDLMAWLSSVP